MNIFSVRKWIQFVGYSDGLILNDLKFLDIGGVYVSDAPKITGAPYSSTGRI